MSKAPETHPERNHAVDTGNASNNGVDTNSVVNFVAVDLGASSGRVVRGAWDGSSFTLHELHRFDNGPVNVLGSLYWDVLGLWREIKTGLRAYAESADAPLAGVSVNTWGVDYALLGASGELLGNPHHYRDSRTDGVMARAFERVPKEELYARTGIQFMQINTVFQLLSSVAAGAGLGRARTLLMMPDLFHYWLTGLTSAGYTVEYTDATTSGLVDAREGRWAVDVLERLGIPAHIFPDIVPPGTVLGALRPDVLSEVGLDGPVSVIATGGHDTASAVAAVPDLDERSAFLSSGTWSLLGAEVREPVLSEKALRLNVTNEGGVGGTVRLLKNVAGLWLLQESRRAWAREGQAYTWEDLARLAEAARTLSQPRQPGRGGLLKPRRHARGGARLLPPHRPARARKRGRDRSLPPGKPGAALPLGGGGVGGTYRPRVDNASRGGGRRAERAPQPVYRRRLRARRRRRTRRGDRAGQPHDAGCGDGAPAGCGGGTTRGR